MKDTLGSELRRLIGPLRRAITRAVPTPQQVASLSDAQVELLRTLERDGELTTTELSERLQIAQPTVSNLTKALHKRDLVTRRLADSDSRSTVIGLSQFAQQELSQSDGERAATVQNALQQLTEQEQQAIAKALPAMESLLVLLKRHSG